MPEPLSVNFTQTCLLSPTKISCYIVSEGQAQGESMISRGISNQTLFISVTTIGPLLTWLTWQIG
jgi:hypothetical protein